MLSSHVELTGNEGIITNRRGTGKAAAGHTCSRLGYIGAPYGGAARTNTDQRRQKPIGCGQMRPFQARAPEAVVQSCHRGMNPRAKGRAAQE